jgi:hypothetical protein
MLLWQIDELRQRLLSGANDAAKKIVPDGEIYPLLSGRFARFCRVNFASPAIRRRITS